VTVNPARGRASLVGGAVVGLAVLALWVLLARDIAPGDPWAILPGAIVAIAVGIWIRVADL